MQIISSMIGILRPKPVLSDGDFRQGLRMMIWEGVASASLFRIVSSGLLAAFAIALGASNLQLGLLSAIPFITQPLQIPVILLVERLRWRKAIVLASWVPAQTMWVLIALIPLFTGGPSQWSVAFLLGFLALRGALAAVTNCAWGSWEKDLVPQGILGNFFPSRWRSLTWPPSASGSPVPSS